MNRRTAIGSFMAGVTMTGQRAFGQISEVETWVAWWERSKAYTLNIANAMPADAWGFKPHNEVSTFGALMVHISDSEDYYLHRFGKGSGPAMPQNPDKATTLAYMSASFDWAIGVVRQLTAADLARRFAGGVESPLTGLDLLLNTMLHTAHTRGYADMYLRAKGIAPPVYAV